MYQTPIKDIVTNIVVLLQGGVEKLSQVVVIRLVEESQFRNVSEVLMERAYE